MAGPVSGFALRVADKVAVAAKDLVLSDVSGLAGDTEGLAGWYQAVKRTGRPLGPERMATLGPCPMCGIFVAPSFQLEICSGGIDLFVGHEILWSDARGLIDNDSEPSIATIVQRHVELLASSRTFDGLVAQWNGVGELSFQDFEGGGGRAYSYVLLVSLYEVGVTPTDQTIPLPGA